MPVEAKIVLGYKNIFGTSSNDSVVETITGICPDTLLLILCKTSSLLFNQKSSNHILSLFASTATKSLKEIQQIFFVLNQKPFYFSDSLVELFFYFILINNMPSCIKWHILNKIIYKFITCNIYYYFKSYLFVKFYKFIIVI